MTSTERADGRSFPSRPGSPRTSRVHNELPYGFPELSPRLSPSCISLRSDLVEGRAKKGPEASLLPASPFLPSSRPSPSPTSMSIPRKAETTQSDTSHRAYEQYEDDFTHIWDRWDSEPDSLRSFHVPVERILLLRRSKVRRRRELREKRVHSRIRVLSFEGRWLERVEGGGEGRRVEWGGGEDGSWR